jgi:hypothetical protein
MEFLKIDPADRLYYLQFILPPRNSFRQICFPNLLRNMSSAWSADIMGQLGQLESELKASQQKSKPHAVQATQAFPVP